MAAATGSASTSSTFNPASWPARKVASRSAMPKYAGMVITTSRNSLPVCSSAHRTSSRRTSADTVSGLCRSPWNMYSALVPISRLTIWATRSGATNAWFLAARPTTALPGDSKNTADGVVSSAIALLTMAGLPVSSI